ncbi:chorismate synthase [Baffinella frigidus]|nr:chorismate synthase [Cryptophyta sp. CCMP2293]
MSSFGTLFRVTTFGESHCPAVGCIVDGVPPRMALTEDDIQVQLDRRRPGQKGAGSIGTARNEADAVQILSGKGVTLGTPIGMFVRNKDMRPHDYGEMSQVPRPSHADFTYQMKYGFRAASGGGRSSARETIGRVAAGAIAEKWLKEKYGVEIVSWVSGVGDIVCPESAANIDTITRDQVDEHMVRCPCLETAEKMTDCIKEARADEDSIGGVVKCLHSEPAQVVALLDTPRATALGFDQVGRGRGGAGALLPLRFPFINPAADVGCSHRGSVHNDMFEIMPDGRMVTTTNHSGGVQGGISNGMPIVLRLAFSLSLSLCKAQPTALSLSLSTVLEAKGRHDPCVVPRAVPIVETMAALVLADFCLMQVRTLPLPGCNCPVGQFRVVLGAGGSISASVDRVGLGLRKSLGM